MSNISDYIPFNLTIEQKVASENIEQFIKSEDDDVFILKGHAGTGKTVLLSGLIKYLSSIEIPVVLLASTGRAAKILSEKAMRSAETVHKCIYILNFEENDHKNKIRKLGFELKTNANKENTVYIVDEVSMISDHYQENVLIKFGTGKLLTDFFLFTGKSKVIFSGDTSQLPPINTVFSPCLREEYLTETFKKNAKSFQLKKVMRFSLNTGISYNTEKLRKSIQLNDFVYPNINVTQFNDMHVHWSIEEMTDVYVQYLKKYGVDQSNFITYSNKLANEINSKVRQQLFFNKIDIQINELLLIVQNNYKYDLANGEHVLVDNIDKDYERRAGLTFIKAQIRVTDANGVKLLSVYIIKELLYSTLSNLSHEQEYELYLDFIIRMQELKIDSNHPQFLEMHKSDLYINALRVKFGYAVTCHKSQGGEWNNVFVALENCLFNTNNKENTYRWLYTALTRSVKQIHLLQSKCVS